MGRLPRILPAGYPAHVVHRGNNRGDIFTCEADFLVMRHCLQEAGLGRDVQLHGYVLMTNHMHLLATPFEDDAISRLMQSATRRYVAYFNKRYGRTGTLWEGRFFSSTVTTERYLLACHRYIDLNPVRAGLARTPDAYRWSSHRHYAFGTADALVTPHASIVALARDPDRRRAAYRDLVAVPLSAVELAAIRQATRTRRRLGDGVKRPGEVSDTDQDAGQFTARSCEPG